MPHPTIHFLSYQIPGDVQSLIPTLGLPAAGFNAYASAGIVGVENRPPTWAFTDVSAAAALGRIIDGPLRSGTDILYAEAALQALLLHEYAEVVVPSVKSRLSNGLSMYRRFDHSERNDASFEVFHQAGGRDQLIALELIDIDASSGEITQSTNPASQILGRRLDSQEAENALYAPMLSTGGEITNALAMQLGVRSYFTSPELLAPTQRGGFAGFIDELYRRVYRGWMEIAQSAPSISHEIRLPPLVAIVLSRASNRTNVIDIVREVRAELAPARAELHRINELLDSSLPQRDIIAQTQRYTAAFDAVVPEALLTDAQRRVRLLTSVFSFAQPVRQVFTMALDPVQVDFEQYAQLFERVARQVALNRRVISRSVAAMTMAELLRTESIRQSIETHFSRSEIDLMRPTSP